MKGFQKLTLAAAIAAAPFAQAMEAMDDALLSEMTGQAGITIDVDLNMSIDAIKYVAGDGAVTIKDIVVDGSSGARTTAAMVHAITIDTDGSKGLVIGLGKIGDTSGNGIDINVGAILINNGSAELAVHNYTAAISTANTAASTTYTVADYSAGTVTTDMTALVTNAIGAASTQEITDAGTAAVGAGDYADATEFGTALAAGETTAVTYLAGQNAGVASAAGAASLHGAAGAALVTAADGITGNIGGVKIENFRNYLQDDLVQKYNGVFSMAIEDSEGSVGSTVDGDQNGRYVQGEIVINGTGSYNSANPSASTSGLQISGLFGGAIDRAAWVDDGGEFGVADLGFFNAVDSDLDGINDTIEGMKFSLNIDVVDRASSVAVENIGSLGGTLAVGTNVSQLHISGISLEGTIMLGQIYVGNADNSVASSLGSVLIKDIDMTGSDIYVYGH